MLLYFTSPSLLSPTKLEKLQAENAQEWGKRERLETEKVGLERDNKKLRHEVEQLEEELDRKNRQASVTMDSDMRTMQMDLADKQKVGLDLDEARVF